MPGQTCFYCGANPRGTVNHGFCTGTTMPWGTHTLVPCSCSANGHREA